MKKNRLMGLLLVFISLCLTGPAQASLTNIGTATYLGADYNLIWDDDNNGKSVVWLDFVNLPDNWKTQINWSAGLGQAITQIDTPGYTVTWDEKSWHLPSTGSDPDNGYNVTNSELGHLFYDELAQPGYHYSNPDQKFSSDAELNDSEFENLVAGWYWSSTEGATDFGEAWAFSMASGAQYDRSKSYDVRGIALRYAQVEPYTAPISTPVPGAVFLMGTGLTCLAAFGRRKA
nr:hypothetical protein [uncultured Desulfobacter sp.]